MSLWLPPEVSKEHRDATKSYNAQVRDMFWFRTPVCQEWTRELQKVDPYLRLGEAKPDVDHPAVTPGYYHLIRENPGAPWTVMPFRNPDGTRAEPSLSMLDMLRGSDLQNQRVTRDRLEAERKRQAELDAEKVRDEEDRQQEILERWRSASETQVSLNDSAPWSQNVKGRRAT